jgi:hypothetical protein
MATLSSVIGWVSIQEAIDLWPDAPGEEADAYAELASLLGAAHEVLAPMGPTMEPAPEKYKQAQLLYTQHLWSRRQSGNAESFGPDGAAVSTFPMVLEAYSLMRSGRSKFRGLV